MQHLPWKFRILFSVNLITQDWVTEVMEMNSDLVCPARKETTKDEAGIVDLPQHFIDRVRRLPRRDYRHLLPVNRMTADRRDDIAVAAPELALAESQVVFANLATRKLSAQLAVRLVMLRYHKAAACVFVESMHNPRSHLSSDPAQCLTMKQKRIDQRPGLHPGSRMNGESSRLIDDQEVVVLVKHRDRNIFRCQVDWVRRWFAENDCVPCAHEISWPAVFAVAQNVTCLDQVLDSRTRKSRQPASKKNVNSLPCLMRLYLEELCLRCVHT